MIDLEIGFLALWLLLATVVAYAWFTRAQRVPGRHRYPELPPQGSHPYPYDGPLMELPAFPDFDPAPKRLATTSELRTLAYAGDMDAVNAEVASLMSVLDSTDTDWTTAA